MRVGRHPHLAVDVLARLQLQPLQPLLVLAERVGGRVERAHQTGEPRRPLLDHADLESREPVEHPVDDHHAHRLHHRVLDGDVVDRAEVVVAAVEVGDRRQAVLEVHRVEEPPAAAHVEHDRDARLLRLRPERVEPDVAGGVPGRARRGDHQRPAAEVEGLACEVGRALEVGERHVPDREQAAVDRAELDDGAVVGAGEAVGDVEVVAVLDSLQRLVGERVEHQLAGERRAGRAPGGRSSARNDPVASQFLRSQICSASWLRNSGSACCRRKCSTTFRTSWSTGQPGPDGQLFDALAHVGVGMRREEIRRLHDVRVGVVDHRCGHAEDRTGGCRRGVRGCRGGPAPARWPRIAP